MPTVRAYAVDDPAAQFHPTTIERREPGANEIFIAVKYCGICHSDIHNARSEWRPGNYPMVPGHEMVGEVTAVGADVTRFKVGDRAGVGCYVWSCGECELCRTDRQQFCAKAVYTYNAIDRDGSVTQGGYSQGITVAEDYAVHVPESIPYEAAAPILCAGVTLYSPLKRWGTGPGKRVAIVGMGGLGHMGVQIAAKMGAEVIVLSQSLSKRDDGIKLGASDYYAMSDPERLQELAASIDLMIVTVSAELDLDLLMSLVKPGGALVDVGLPTEPASIRMRSLTFGNKAMAGSQIGGMQELQEIVDFCAEHKIAPVVEVISADEITEAYDKVVASKVRYRYVIDTATM